MEPEKLRDLANCLLMGGLFFAMLGTGGVNYYRAKVERGKDASAKLKDAQRVEKEIQLNLKIDSLLEGNANLQSAIAPFETLAKQRYPALGTNDALSKLEIDLKGLTARTSAIESKAQARILSEEQFETLKLALQSCAGAEVRFDADGDAETKAFTRQLQQAFVAAGWTSPTAGTVVGGLGTRGIQLQVNDKIQHPCAGLVQAAFAAIGYKADGAIAEGYPTDRIDILVGEKPA